MSFIKKYMSYILIILAVLAVLAAIFAFFELLSSKTLPIDECDGEAVCI